LFFLREGGYFLTEEIHTEFDRFLSGIGLTNCLLEEPDNGIFVNVIAHITELAAVSMLVYPKLLAPLPFLA